MSDVNRAAVPYMAWQVVLVVMILLYPPVATWLPSLMAK
jgi:TRAP-type mannitol/chloroaromatic compound transport system permease large subunit